MADIDLARNIIMQKAQTEEDITELQRIRFRMSENASEMSRIAAEQEQEYEQIRAKEFARLKSCKNEKGKYYSDLHSNQEAKAIAEERIGKYRETKAKAIGMKTVIDAIAAFCTDYYVKRKDMRDASMTTN